LREGIHSPSDPPVGSGFSRIRIRIPTIPARNGFRFGRGMDHHHAHPLRDFDYAGFCHYSLTWCCEDRKPLFTQEDRVKLILSQLFRAATESESAIVAYCFMPDHLHQLVKGCSASADGKKYMKRAKQYAGYYYSRPFGEKPFQRYGYDRWHREDTEIPGAVRYIIENPVRAGLVERPELYPFTGSQLYSMKELMEWAYR